MVSADLTLMKARREKADDEPTGVAVCSDSQQLDASVRVRFHCSRNMSDCLKHVSLSLNVCLRFGLIDFY
jgi:hypothetical protein